MRAFYAVLPAFVSLALSAVAMADPPFIDNHDGTVTDNSTKLTWQQKADGMTRSWDEASAYCGKLNLASRSGWRLPSFAELKGLWSKLEENKQIEKTYFPTTKLSPIGPMGQSVGLVAPYWSSTLINMQGQQAADVVDFSNGKGTAATIHGVIFGSYARCVRQ